MKTTAEVRLAISEFYGEDISQSVSLFENPDFNDAIVGVDPEAKKVIYDYDKMVKCLMDEYGMTEDEAVEFLSINTIRTLPYIPNAPIVMGKIFGLEEEFEEKDNDEHTSIFTFPCKIGDEIWVLDDNIEHCIVDEFSIKDHGVYASGYVMNPRYGYETWGKSVDEFGKTWFLSEEEAVVAFNARKDK